MTNTPDITPPPELVRQWYDKAFQNPTGAWSQQVAKAAAQWGADQELEACCEVLARELICDGKHVATDLRMIRRPKPPSLKDQALDDLHIAFDRGCLSEGQADTIRRALEQLND